MGGLTVAAAPPTLSLPTRGREALPIGPCRALRRRETPPRACPSQGHAIGGKGEDDGKDARSAGRSGESPADRGASPPPRGEGMGVVGLTVAAARPTLSLPTRGREALPTGPRRVSQRRETPCRACPGQGHAIRGKGGEVGQDARGTGRFWERPADRGASPRPGGEEMGVGGLTVAAAPPTLSLPTRGREALPIGPFRVLRRRETPPRA